MGSIGMPELVILGIVIPTLLLGIFIIILIVKKISKGSQSGDQKSSVEARLAKMEALKSEGLITDAEYQEKRMQILDDV